MAYASHHRMLAKAVFALAALGISQARAQPVVVEGNVKLKPVMERIDLVTDVNVVGNTLFVCTQPGLLLTKGLGTRSTTDFSVFLDIRAKVGPLGDRIPALPGLGYPVPGTYDERGLLGFAAEPSFNGNGRFWIWYTNINQHSANPPNFFQWLVSTSQPWNRAEYDHIAYIAEYVAHGGVPVFQRTVLKIKRPYFNHTGFQSLVWSPESDTLVIGLGDGGSEYDPNNISQDDDQLSGKLLKIDLGKLRGRDFTNSPAVATFSDLDAQGVPKGAFTGLIKGMRNPSKVHYEQVKGNHFIKYLANTGQDTIEFIHAFESYGLNFGFRPWEGIFPTSFETDVPAPPESDQRAIAYGLEASRLYPSVYRPAVHYTHLDEKLGPNANTGSALYTGNAIPHLKGELVFTDWISFSQSPRQGLLMHAAVNRDDLQQPQTVKKFNVNLSEANLRPGQPIFYTTINTDADGDRIFVGAFKDIQFIVNQRNNPLGSDGLMGGVYEVLKN